MERGRSSRGPASSTAMTACCRGAFAAWPTLCAGGGQILRDYALSIGFPTITLVVAPQAQGLWPHAREQVLGYVDRLPARLASGMVTTSRTCRWRCRRPHLEGTRGARRNAVDVDAGLRPLRRHTATPNARNSYGRIFEKLAGMNPKMSAFGAKRTSDAGRS